ncbi:TrmH family RNA methyltransferase [Paraliomyxa miuraensis]|uniref:TrmH family RNA methyltransferase n=1 Tax=Paraliomyxa miuraensis TaxID=376150 RepID=UPI002258B161|nr:RNA methyltransferase [Paraliomyxa miuraensis]MCX4240111.1 RNA methyltransferase [Paraliomyxa miuraensis]
MDLHAAEALVAEHGADQVIGALEPYLTEARRARIDTVLDGRMRSVHVAIESPSDPHNAAAVVRTCEAMGALAVHVVAAEGRALRARAVTQGSFHWVETHEHRDLAGLLSQVRARGMVLAGACMDGSVPVGRLRVQQPLCLLFGNEQRGLSATARRACDVLFHVPMVGMSESLNLSVSAAISLYEVMRRKREAGPQGDLSPEERKVLRACYFLGSVDARLVHGLWGPWPRPAEPVSASLSSSPSEADAR